MIERVQNSISEEVKNGLALPLMEHFYTLQGEGYHTGTPAYFIRLAGCDVGCVWCDVKESWDSNIHDIISVSEMVSHVEKAGARFCVVTGGEPATYNLVNLTDQLRAKNIYTAIETSGVYPLTGNWHWVCFSPKKFKVPHEGIYNCADELKVIIYNKSDFSFAKQHAAKVKDTCKLYLQPEWSKADEMLPQIIDYIKSHPQWRLSLQTHKFLNIP
jgi:7-carboxy-7-deazaguanine synthase